MGFEDLKRMAFKQQNYKNSHNCKKNWLRKYPNLEKSFKSNNKTTYINLIIFNVISKLIYNHFVMSRKNLLRNSTN